MPLLLLMLLATVALFITLIGYLLTSKNQAQSHHQRTAYQGDYYVNRGMRRVGRVGEPLATPRVVAYTEQSLWAGVWQSLAVSAERMFKRRAGEPAPWLGIIIILVSLFILVNF
jgi:hypothetical protein